jgi:hypothetical protein
VRDRVVVVRKDKEDMQDMQDMVSELSKLYYYYRTPLVVRNEMFVLSWLVIITIGFVFIGYEQTKVI